MIRFRKIPEEVDRKRGHRGQPTKVGQNDTRRGPNACVEQLRIAHSVEESVMIVDERVQIVGDDVQNVGKNVEDVRTEVQGVDRELDDINRSSSLIAHPLLPNAQAYSQGTCFATIFYVGSRLRIHP